MTVSPIRPVSNSTFPRIKSSKLTFFEAILNLITEGFPSDRYPLTVSLSKSAHLPEYFGAKPWDI